MGLPGRELWASSAGNCIPRHGDNTFYYVLGDGNDVITNAGNNDTIAGGEASIPMRQVAVPANTLIKL